MTTITYEAKAAAPVIRTRSCVTARVMTLVAVLRELASGAEYNTVLGTRADAQFALLPRSQQNAQLDRGYGPR